MTLGTIVLEAVKLARKMREDHATDDERQAVIEATIREVWPRGREWKYICEACRDTGLVLREGVKNHLGTIVDVGYACDCPRGDRFKPKSPTPEDYMDAGKTPKRSTFTRIGG